MLYFIPQGIFILSLGAIIFIVLRRIPQVTVRDEERPVPMSEESGEAQPAPPAKRLITRAWQGLKLLGSYAQEAKDHTIRAQYLQRFMKVVAFRNLGQRIKTQTTVVITKNQIRQAEELVQNDDFVLAERALIKIIERDPSNQEAYESLGQMYLDRKKFKEALEVYDFLVKHHAKDDRYWSKLGMAQYQLGNYTQAVKAYQRAVDLAPGKSNRYINLSLSYASLGQMAQAESAAKTAVKLSPDNPQYLIVLADCEVELGKKQSAKDLLERALEIEPTSDEARQRLMKLKF